MTSKKKPNAGGDKKIPQYYLIVPMIEKQFFNAIPQISPIAPTEIKVQILTKTLASFGRLMLYTEEKLGFNEFLQKKQTEAKCMHLKVMSSDLEELFAITAKINDRAARKVKKSTKEIPHVKFIQCPSSKRNDIRKEFRKGQQQRRKTRTISLKIGKKEKIREENDCGCQKPNQIKKRKFCSICANVCKKN